ncbi:hypothetical protein RJZ57_000661 [Blastomyces gilchristii]|nr:hypothetical protein BDFG_03724 [Blastomyces dermatitidis ATCC 26199]
MGSLNIVTDLALILFPIPMLWRMTSLDFQARHIGCCNNNYATASDIKSLSGSNYTFSGTCSKTPKLDEYTVFSANGEILSVATL